MRDGLHHHFLRRVLGIRAVGRHAQREPVDVVAQQAHELVQRGAVPRLSALYQRLEIFLHDGQSTSAMAFSTASSCCSALTLASNTSSGIPGAWNCVKTYSAPVPRGIIREAASASTPGAGEIQKSTTPLCASAATRRQTSPPAVCTSQAPACRRTDLAKPTAQRGRFAGSARKRKSSPGGASIDTHFVS